MRKSCFTALFLAAVLAFTAVIEIDPKNGDAYYGRAQGYMALAAEEEDPAKFADYLALAGADYGQAAAPLTANMTSTAAG